MGYATLDDETLIRLIAHARAEALSELYDGYSRLVFGLALNSDGLRTSGGVFAVNPEGYGALWISSPEPLSSYPAFGITIEPVGGSPGPTGEKVLGGNP
jgi:hypothetical protein